MYAGGRTADLARLTMNERGWGNIENAFQWATYNGFTVLRRANVTTGSELGQRRYRDLSRNAKQPATFLASVEPIDTALNMGSLRPPL
jgi:hypothetical protein